MPREGATWKRWLADEQVFRWYRSMVIRTEVTADERLRVLSRYCDAVKTTPMDLVERAQKPKGISAVADQMQDFVTLLRTPHKPADHGEEDGEAARERCAKGHSPGYVANFVKSLRAWLRHNDIGLVRKIVVGDDGATPTVENERTPTPRELRGILAAADERGKVIISFLAFSGVRPEVLGARKAANGLRLEDLPDVRVRGGEIRFLDVPARVIVRRELSKVRKRYFTFLAREGCEYLKAYLDHRIARGEKLEPDSPIVRPDYGYEVMGRPEGMKGSPFLGTQGITGEVRKAFRARGFRARPYVLRSYFDSALASAEREGKVIPLDREFLMGRVTAVEQRYTNLKELAANVIEEMRREFAACAPYLETRRQTAPASDLAEFLRSSENEEVLRLLRELPEVMGQLKPLLERTKRLKEGADPRSVMSPAFRPRAVWEAEPE